MPYFLAFSGKKQVGKDTATGIAVKLLQESGKHIQTLGFADVLKDMCITVFGLDGNLVYGTNEDKQQLTKYKWDNLPDNIRWKYRNDAIWPRSGNMTIREMLQVVGTDIFREMFDQDIWVNAALDQDWEGTDVVIVTDCRFPGEKLAIEDRDGIVVRINRDTGLQDSHASETALDDALFVTEYNNNGTLEELQQFVEGELKRIELI
jgi:hypothetical protein